VTSASQTLHVRGTVKDQTEAVIPRTKVVFQNKQFDKTVTTDERGDYEADLPIGDYTMTAQAAGFRPYRRPLFRTTSAETIAFDFTLPVMPTCDLSVVSTNGGTATPEDLEAAQEQFCSREEYLSLPSSDGVPFQIWIHYGKHIVTGDRHVYTGEKTRNNDPVLVNYNLFSLRADEVVYDARSKTIRATGNAMAVDESGTTRRVDAMEMKFENGKVIVIR
jgi:hypothetical protein